MKFINMIEKIIITTLNIKNNYAYFDVEMQQHMMINDGYINHTCITFL